MKTFTSWIVANIEIVLAVITTILGILIFIFGVELNYTDEQFANILIAGIIMFVFYGFISLMKSFEESIFLFLFALLIFICGSVFESETDPIGSLFFLIRYCILGSWGIGWLIFAVSCVLGIITAIFSSVNFSEVTSRSMLYRNSNVSMFESRVKYVINRFCVTTTSFMFSILIIKLIVASV